jgi:streptomycin 6-kinase
MPGAWCAAEGRVRDVPEFVRSKVVAQGDAGRRWLRELDTLVEHLEQEWSVTVGETFDGGTEAFVAAATGPAGEALVVKLAVPGTELGREARVLERANGRGYVRLFRYDSGLQAMLLERLGVSLIELGLPVRRQIEIVCATLAESWEASPDPELPSGGDKARRLSEYIATTWQALGRPCSERVVERALRFAADRAAAFDPETAVLAHGDAQSFNTLRAADGSFRLVDPDGLHAEREYDVAVQLREWDDEPGRGRAAFVAALTGLDVTAIWEWAFVERVSTGLFCLDVGMLGPGSGMLRVAEDWANE